MTEAEYIQQGKEAYARIDSYAEAIKLNSKSEAVELRKMTMNIIEFYCKDRFNP